MSHSKLVKLGFARSGYTWRHILQRENAIAVYPGGHFPRESPNYAVESLQATRSSARHVFASKATVSGRMRILEPHMYPVVTGLLQNNASDGERSSANIHDENVNMLSYLTQALKETSEYESLLTRNEVLPLQARNRATTSVLCHGLLKS